MKRLAIDLDSTVWKQMDIFIPMYNKEYNENIISEEIDEWHYFPQDRFMNIYLKVVKKIKEFEPVDIFVGEYISLLSRYYNISFLTHGEYTRQQIVVKLLSLGIYRWVYNDIIITKIPKAVFDFDYFIDDNPLMVKDMKDFPSKTLLLLSTTYNKYIKKSLPDNVIIRKNWKQIKKYLMRCK